MAAASFNSFAEMFLHRVASTPDTDAFYYPDAQDEWQTIQWRAVGARVRALACGLRSLGLELEERCAILASTRYEWILIDLAIACGRGATTTIYASTIAEDCAYILVDSKTRYVFVEDDEQLAKLLEVRDQLGDVRKVITIDGQGGHDGWVITLDELAALGAAWDAENEGAYQAGIDGLRPEHLATLIYTSGTTGRPKGVELLHDCWVYEGEAMDGLGILTPADKQYLWLPLAHSFGKVLEAAVIRIGIPTAVDGRLDRIVPNLAEVQPTFVAAVPRIFEKIYSKVVTGAQEGGPNKYRAFKWALDIGREVSQRKQLGSHPSGLLAVRYALADRLVFSKLRALFGGRMRFFISGSAPLNRELAEFFHAAGVLILEGYGLTESSAASFVNRPDKFKFGTVGVGVPGMEVKIDPADGEILLKSRGVMRGYHQLAEQSAEALTEDGWLRTGDIGEIDEHGFLKITDRKKNLIKTSGGKYVAPQEIEGRLKTASPLISQVLVHGNARNFCTALVTVDAEALTRWAEKQGRGGQGYADLTQSPELQAEIQGAFDRVNDGLNRYERVKAFAILERDFSIEGGELTPSQKMKRKHVEQMYQDTLDAFYAGAIANL